MSNQIEFPERLVFKDDGQFPNSQLPLLLYRDPLQELHLDLAGVFESRFARNGWTNSWRNGVFDYDHYHSTTHEVLAVYRGNAFLRFGGPVAGRDVSVQAGNVIIIPAGVSHKRVTCSDDFGVVGAYPDGREWDILRGDPGERPAADERMAALPMPTSDPLFGTEGPLTLLWQSTEM